MTKSSLFFLLAVFPVMALANQNARIPTPTELRQLPLYCKDTQIISTYYGRQQGPSSHDATTATWVKTYGEDFWHMHHYCFAMTYVLRSYRLVNKNERMGLVSQSLGEFEYVLKSAKPEFPLRPEIHVKKGQVLGMLGRGAEAVIEFRKAIDIKSDYPGPYGFLSDYYVESGDKAKAIQVLEEGLTANPGSDFLQRRYRELGGKKTFEAPAIVKAVETPQTPPSKQTETAETTPPVEILTVEPTPEERGNNPYCRFCP